MFKGKLNLKKSDYVFIGVALATSVAVNLYFFALGRNRCIDEVKLGLEDLEKEFSNRPHREQRSENFTNYRQPQKEDIL